ncbi:MAG: Transcriptional regulator MarR, partial [uncultured Pseudonocardia sp.]
APGRGRRAHRPRRAPADRGRSPAPPHPHRRPRVHRTAAAVRAGHGGEPRPAAPVGAGPARGRHRADDEPGALRARRAGPGGAHPGPAGRPRCARHPLRAGGEQAGRGAHPADRARRPAAGPARRRPAPHRRRGDAGAGGAAGGRRV